jgi:hypothetical protein
MEAQVFQGQRQNPTTQDVIQSIHSRQITNITYSNLVKLIFNLETTSKQRIHFR